MLLFFIITFKLTYRVLYVYYFQIIFFLESTDILLLQIVYDCGGHRGRDCLVIGFTTTYAISAYHH
jgi:hypothetical protein